MPARGSRIGVSLARGTKPMIAMKSSMTVLRISMYSMRLRMNENTTHMFTTQVRTARAMNILRTIRRVRRENFQYTPEL